MSSQSILVTATPSSGIIDLALVEASVVIDIRNYVGWGFDLNIDSTDALGVVTISSQYTNFLVSAEESEPDVIADVSSGSFIDGSKKLVIDSNNAITRGYVKIKWQQSGASTGVLNIVGVGTIRG